MNALINEYVDIKSDENFVDIIEKVEKEGNLKVISWMLVHFDKGKLIYLVRIDKKDYYKFLDAFYKIHDGIIFEEF